MAILCLIRHLRLKSTDGVAVWWRSLALPFSTEPETVRELPASWKDNLYNRVVFVGDPRRSVVPVLDRWVKEGKSVEKTYLQGMISRMKDFKRYSHALEISMWMSDNRFFTLSPGDHAIRLQMISKLHGLDHAEKYFSDLPMQFKVTQLHNALLNCYKEEKEDEKAEAIFQKMRESNMANNHTYNILMKLYINIKEFDKVDTIFEQMKKDSLVPDIFSYNSLLEAYANSSNTEGIEKVLEEIRQSNVAADWYTYANAGKGYVKTGLFDKALLLLAESEKVISKKNGRIPYSFLLTQYAEMGNKDKIYQIWNLYKTQHKIPNSIYMCMMSSLLKIDDTEGAEAILKEWEAAAHTYFDFAVPNILLSAYCKKGDLEKAEALVNKAVEGGRKPYCNSWDRLAGLYFASGQKLKGVEAMKKALSSPEARKFIWKPNLENVSAVFEFFAEERDVEEAEEFLKLLKNTIPMTRELWECLHKIYVLAEKPVDDLIERIREDGFEI